MRPFSISPFASAMKIPGPIAFSFSGYEVYWSGILLAFGVIFAILMAQYEVRRKKLPPDTAVDICLIGIPLGVLGARLFYVFTNFSLFRDDLIRILHFWDGGLSIYGALIGVIAGIVIYSLSKKLRFFMLTDLLVPGLLLTQSLALWGDFFEQRGFGPQISSRAMQWFPFAVRIEETNTIHAAVFFYEFLWCLLVLAALWFLVRKRTKRDGDVTLWYLLLYPIGHIALSLIRQNGNYLFGGVRMTVLVGAVLTVFALVMLIVRWKKPAPLQEETEPVDDTTDEPNEEDKPADPDTDETPKSGESTTTEETEKNIPETKQPEPETTKTEDEEPTGKEA